ncbi:MAG: hypothetical protein ACE5JP_07745 [Candidatus Bipolaricaulia bacterium]
MPEAYWPDRNGQPTMELTFQAKTLKVPKSSSLSLWTPATDHFDLPDHEGLIGLPFLFR